MALYTTLTSRVSSSSSSSVRFLLLNRCLRSVSSSCVSSSFSSSSSSSSSSIFARYKPQSSASDPQCKLIGDSAVSHIKRIEATQLNAIRQLTMAPIGNTPADKVNELIAVNRVMVFSKTTCPFCVKVKKLLDSIGVKYTVYETDVESDGSQIKDALAAKLGKTSVPQVFIKGVHVGGCDDTHAAQESGKLRDLLKDHDFDYDLVVIGGGSGGLAASKEAARLGRKVALLDYVVPTPMGTTWGLGGTCVNVGCIPKKLMHQASLIGESIKYGHKYGWHSVDDTPLEQGRNVKHDWNKMVDAIQANIKSSNFKYRVAVRQEKVNYLNCYGEFVDAHTLRIVNKNKEESLITSQHFLVATGERPRYPQDCQGALEYGITSDDLFSLPYAPGKTVVVGASYVALECAGFLNGLGYDTTVLVRSILLRGFDQDCAEKVGQHMEEVGIKFERPCVPFRVEKLKDPQADQPGLYRVHARRLDTNAVVTVDCNTVLFAIGRKPCTDNIGLEKVGVKVNANGKVPVVNEQTNVSHVYAVGDILQDKPELTPVAIEAGILLAKRLYAGAVQQCDYVNVPTTVFTPMEYGFVGLSEEKAIQLYGENDVEVYVQYMTPFEWNCAHHLDNKCYAKLITRLSENERVIGLHYIGPNAGEVTQFAALALKKNATKAEFDSVIGIHPTSAEVFTNLKITKRSGISPKQALCCG